MGQGIAVTPIQMASAFSTVAYNGWQVKPRLVAQVGADGLRRGREAPRDPGARWRARSASMLALAVDEGTGTEAQIPGYEVAGKTGTAEMAAARRRRLRQGRLRGLVHRHGARPTTPGWSSCAP